MTQKIEKINDLLIPESKSGEKKKKYIIDKIRSKAKNM